MIRLRDEHEKSWDENRYALLRGALDPLEQRALLDWVETLAAWPETPGRWMKYFEGDGRQLCRVENFLPYHDGLRALKVGITNQTTERLSKYERDGWTLVDLWFHDVGEDASIIEQAVLASWKNYAPPVRAEDMPQGGHTETVSLDDVSEAEAVSLIEGFVAGTVAT